MFLLIADISGYTTFMKAHRLGLAHAQDIVARLLESIIDASKGDLTFAKLEGDAVFLYAAYPPGAEPNLTHIAALIASLYRSFHSRISVLSANRLCPCDACQHVGNLKIKFVGHIGDVAVQKVKKWTELAGVDVIVVHRMLKNNVPVAEYFLMTEPVLRRTSDSLRGYVSALKLNLEGLEHTDAFFVDLAEYVKTVPPTRRASLPSRLGSLLALCFRTTPYFVGLKNPCRNFHNLGTDDSH